MRRLLLLLALLSLSFPSFGYSRITLERVWTIHSDGSPYDFTGAIAVNNTNQKVVSISVSPGMDHYMDANKTVWVHANGSGEEITILRAKVTVDIDYDPAISSDPPLPLDGVLTTELTDYDLAMASQAVRLAREDSSLTTIVNLVNFVHSYVEYDLSYWGRIRSAKDVFSEKKGVCVEYTHLLLSLLKSLGFETRYVNGYVKANNWQPHAWAEVDLPGYGWLPADPTFAQVGVLDNTHVAINYGEDQASAFDLLLTEDADAQIEVSEKVNANFLSEDPKGVALSLGYDPGISYAEVELANRRPYYALGYYSFYAPDSAGGGNSSVILLSPNQTSFRYHKVDYSLMDGGLEGIPLSASFNDAMDQASAGPLGTGAPLEPPLCCSAALLIPLLLASRKAA